MGTRKNLSQGSCNSMPTGAACSQGLPDHGGVLKQLLLLQPGLPTQHLEVLRSRKQYVSLRFLPRDVLSPALTVRAKIAKTVA